MTGSIQEDFAWHLDAATRVLLILSFLVMLGFGSSAEPCAVRQ